MIRAILVLLTLVGVAFSLIPEGYSSPKSCAVVENHGLDPLMDGALSAFWGYDLIGVDLARKSITESGVEIRPVPIFSGEEFRLNDLPEAHFNDELKEARRTEASDQLGSHGSAMISIVAGESPIGIALSPRIVGQASLSNETRHEIPKEAGAKIFVASQSIYNPIFAAMSADGVISVRSAGNTFPVGQGYQVDVANSIMVGQLSPFGGPSGSSSSYPEVAILAPGANYAKEDNLIRLFGGTSGAQPAVSGCLVNVLSILPDLSPDEAKALIAHTSSPMIDEAKEELADGIGVLNCYKMARVALRLQADWKNRRGEILKPKSKAYQFAKEIAKIDREISDFDPQWDDCEKREALDRLRKRFLLGGYDLTTFASLAEIYESEGFVVNSYYFRTQMGWSTGDLDQLHQMYAFREGSKIGDFEEDIVRLSALAGVDTKKVLDRALESKDPWGVPTLLGLHYGMDHLTRERVHQGTLNAVNFNVMTPYNYDYFIELIGRSEAPGTPLIEACLTQLGAGNADVQICFYIAIEFPTLQGVFMEGVVELDPDTVGYLPDFALSRLDSEAAARVVDHPVWNDEQRAALKKLLEDDGQD